MSDAGRPSTYFLAWISTLVNESGTLPAQEEALYRLALGLTEAAAAIEVYGMPEVPFVDKPHVVSTTWSDGTR